MIKYHPKDKEELCELVEYDIIKLGEIDVSAITDMSNLFFHSKRKDYSGIESWSVSQVKDMRWMFMDCNFKGDLSGWQLRADCKVKRMFDRNFPEEKRPQVLPPEEKVKPYPRHVRIMCKKK